MNNPLVQYVREKYNSDGYLCSEVANMDGQIQRMYAEREAFYSYSEQRGLWLGLFRALLMGAMDVQICAGQADQAFALVHARWPKLDPGVRLAPDPQEPKP